MKLSFDGVITKDRKLKLFKRNTFDRALLTFPPDQLVTLTISKARKDRTDKQNAYYWGVVVKILADHFGYEQEEMHTELKRMFNPQASRLTVGETYGGSTRKLSTTEFNDYIDRIVRWAAVENQIVIPDPNEVEV